MRITTSSLLGTVGGERPRPEAVGRHGKVVGDPSKTLTLLYAPIRKRHLQRNRRHQSGSELHLQIAARHSLAGNLRLQDEKKNRRLRSMD